MTKSILAGTFNKFTKFNIRLQWCYWVEKIYTFLPLPFCIPKILSAASCADFCNIDNLCKMVLLLNLSAIVLGFICFSSCRPLHLSGPVKRLFYAYDIPRESVVQRWKFAFSYGKRLFMYLIIILESHDLHNPSIFTNLSIPSMNFRLNV